FATPIENMPEAIQWVTCAIPLRYFLIICRRVFLEGATADLLVAQYWPMAVIGLITLFAATVLFRRRIS
ncbi:MAG: antibiotic ABC transporter permease, partial [Alphaproteobacteria bacterium]|nr:antibiotic ABC transporter permease [Alphaproteobacteria bacterium]